MGISDIMERQMKDMKRKLPFRKVAVFLILALFLTAGISMRAVTVNAATYVKQDRTSVSITSKKTGWQKINGDYYFYNSKGRLICGSFKYKGYYYYSIANGIISMNPAWQLPGSGLLRMEKNTISSAIPPWQRAGRR